MYVLRIHALVYASTPPYTYMTCSICMYYLRSRTPSPNPAPAARRLHPTPSFFFLDHPGVELRANLKSISHRFHLFGVAFVWKLTKETINLLLGCLQGGYSQVPAAPRLNPTPCTPNAPWDSTVARYPCNGAESAASSAQDQPYTLHPQCPPRPYSTGVHRS